jgi:hypothetical protein
MIVAASLGAVGIKKFGPIEIPIPLAVVRFDFYVFTVTAVPPAVATKGFTTAVNEGVLGSRTLLLARLISETWVPSERKSGETCTAR